MWKRLTAILLALGMTVGTAPAPVGGGGGITGEGRNPKVLTVGSDGGQYTTICGNDCSASSNQSCLAGSAIEAARSLTPSATNPVTIKIAPGVYDECVVVTDLNYVHLQGSGVDTTIIKPTLDTPAISDVAGGVLRIADDDDATKDTTWITVSDMTIRNDGFSGPESAVQIGKESCDAGEIATWDQIYNYNIKAIGFHDAWQVCGDRQSGATNSDLPQVLLRDSVIIGGRDGITKKGYMRMVIQNVDVTIWSNYASGSDPNNLYGTITGSFQADPNAGYNWGTFSYNAGTLDPNTFFIVNWLSAYDSGKDVFSNRKIAVADTAGSDCGAVANGCDGATGTIVDFDPNNNRIRIMTDAGTTSGLCTGLDYIDEGCDYTISPYPMGGEAPDTALSWIGLGIRAKSAGTIAQSGWKYTCLHVGNLGAATAPAEDSLIVNGLNCRMFVNDLTNTQQTSAGCGGQEHINGVLGCYGNNTAFGTEIFTDVSIEINVAAHDTPGDPNNVGGCVPRVAGFAVRADCEGVTRADFSGNIVINNSGAKRLSAAGILVDADGAATVNVSKTYIDINNTVAGYTGTSHALWQGDAGVINAQDVTSDAVITTAGTIKGWSERCFTYPDFVVGTDDQPIPVSDASVGLQLAYGGCRCLGTCGAAEDISFEDDAGNAIGSAVACVDNTADMTWTDLRADTDALIPASKSPRFDTTTASGTATDDLQVCVRYSTSRFAP